MNKSPWWGLGSALVVLAAAVVGCPASGPTARSGSPAGGASTAAPTPTGSALSRTNPNIIEEDDLHVVERFPKQEYIRVDDQYFRSPIITLPVKYFKEDDKYFYVYTYKRSKEQADIDAALKRQETPATPAPPAPGTTPTPSGPSLADFEDIAPPREAGRIRLVPAASGTNSNCRPHSLHQPFNIGSSESFRSGAGAV